MATVVAVNDLETRQRLSASAVRAFLSLARSWQLTQAEQVDLLGASVTRQTLNNWARGSSATLSADQLMRISYMLGLYEGLQRIWRRSPQLADAWLRRPRPERPFEGQQPIEFMRRGGIPALQQARVYVDGVTGGPPSRADYTAPPRESDRAE
jgi:hypothetical protein